MTKPKPQKKPVVRDPDADHEKAFEEAFAEAKRKSSVLGYFRKKEKQPPPPPKRGRGRPRKKVPVVVDNETKKLPVVVTNKNTNNETARTKRKDPPTKIRRLVLIQTGKIMLMNSRSMLMPGERRKG